MSIQYKVVKQSVGSDETNTGKYVLKTVTIGMLSFNKSNRNAPHA